jgi:hypothetical protein
MHDDSFVAVLKLGTRLVYQKRVVLNVVVGGEASKGSAPNEP